jgi:hypothetical protein
MWSCALPCNPTKLWSLFHSASGRVRLRLGADHEIVEVDDAVSRRAGSADGGAVDELNTVANWQLRVSGDHQHGEISHRAVMRHAYIIRLPVTSGLLARLRTRARARARTRTRTHARTRTLPRCLRTHARCIMWLFSV